MDGQLITQTGILGVFDNEEETETTFDHVSVYVEEIDLHYGITVNYGKSKLKSITICLDKDEAKELIKALTTVIESGETQQ